jgi:hypothetical protein
MSTKPRSPGAAPIEPDQGPSGAPERKEPPAPSEQPSNQPAPDRTGVPKLTVIQGLGLRPERAWAARVASNPPPPVSEPEPPGIESDPLEAETAELEPTKERAREPEHVDALVSRPRRSRIRRPLGIPPELPRWARTSVRIGDPSIRQTGRPWWSLVVPGKPIRKGAGRSALVAVLVALLLIAAPLVIDALREGGSVDRSGSTASTPSPHETRVGEVGGVTPVHERFDDLAMDSGLPEPWTVTGNGTAAIVALPTSVDRSVRLASNETGAPTTACLSVDGVRAPEVTIAVDYHVGRSPASPFPLLSLEANGTQTFALLVDSMGMPVGITSPGGPRGVIDSPTSAPTRAIGAASPAWRHVDLTVTWVSGEVSWSVRDSSGRATHSGAGTLAAGLVVVPLETLCLHSPEGEPLGWVAIDDISVD